MDDLTNNGQNQSANNVPNAAPAPAATTPSNTMPDTSAAPEQDSSVEATHGVLESAFVSSGQAETAPTTPPASSMPIPGPSDQISFSKGPEPTPVSTITPPISTDASVQIPSTSPIPAMTPPISTSEPSNPPTLEQTGAAGIYSGATPDAGRLEGAPLPENTKKPASVMSWVIWIVFIALLVGLFVYEPTGSKIMDFINDNLLSKISK